MNCLYFKILFVFENSDFVEVYSKNILSFDIKDNKFNIMLSENADKLYHPFGFEDYQQKYTFSRFTLKNDIAQIHLLKKDGMCDIYFLKWDDDPNDLTQNLNEVIIKDKCGNLIIECEIFAAILRGITSRKQWL